MNYNDVMNSNFGIIFKDPSYPTICTINQDCPAGCNCSNGMCTEIPTEYNLKIKFYDLILQGKINQEELIAFSKLPLALAWDICLKKENE